MKGQVSEITKRYYETTSSRSVSLDSKRWERAGVSLKRRLGPWLPRRGEAVLDLGCGLGELCGLAGACGASLVVGVDLCAEELELARKHVKGEFVQADITKYLRVEKRKFDWIGCLNILEHFPKDLVVEILKLAKDRLNPGGVLIAMVPNAISPMGMMTRHWDFTHEWAFTPNNFRQLEALCGYGKYEFRECGPVPHGVISGLRYVAWQMIRMAIAGYLLIEKADAKGGIYTSDMLVRLTVSTRLED
jgi:SAM-dependent methyltransferase